MSLSTVKEVAYGRQNEALAAKIRLWPHLTYLDVEQRISTTQVVAVYSKVPQHEYLYEPSATQMANDIKYVVLPLSFAVFIFA